MMVTKINLQGQKDLPAAFDKQDKDQFVADCKEVGFLCYNLEGGSFSLLQSARRWIFLCYNLEGGGLSLLQSGRRRFSLLQSPPLSLLFSVPEHSFRELQEDLLVLMEVLPGMWKCTLYTSTHLIHTFPKSVLKFPITHRQPTQTETARFRALSSRR